MELLRGGQLYSGLLRPNWPKSQPDQPAFDRCVYSTAYMFRRNEVRWDEMSDKNVPGRGEVDERDVDALAALQLDAPRTGERAVAT